MEEDLSVPSSMSVPSSISSKDLYTCNKVEIWKPEVPGAEFYSDFALIRLNKTALDRKSIPVDFSKPSESQEVSLLGYSELLPLKHSKGEIAKQMQTDEFLSYMRSTNGASDEQIENAEHFYSKVIPSKIDKFIGNSGGPLLQSSGAAIIGVDSIASPKGLAASTTTSPSGEQNEIFHTLEKGYPSYYHYDGECIRVLDCDDDDVLCVLHTGAVSLLPYKERLIELGVKEIGD